MLARRYSVQATDSLDISSDHQSARPKPFMFTIRNARETDLPAIIEIYNQSIPAGRSTADTVPITVAGRVEAAAVTDPPVSRYQKTEPRLAGFNRNCGCPAIVASNADCSFGCTQAGTFAPERFHFSSHSIPRSSCLASGALAARATVVSARSAIPRPFAT